MSISLVEKEILRFLKTSEAEVICVKGDWGIGKTYSWNEFLMAAKRSNEIALNSYAYVSLFGIGSLDQLKYSIFENSVSKDDIGSEPSVKTFNLNASAVINKLGRRVLSFITILPQAKDYASAFQSISFLTVREKLICIDDLERKGEGLSMKDIMGLISYLRDQKKCKVALILNDGELKDTDKEEFERYFEKVVDSSLLFKPDPGDSARIALKGEEQGTDWLRSCVVTLGISNVRAIKKIERLVSHLAPFLEGYDAKVMKQAVHSLALLGWSTYCPSEAPSLEFILHKRGKNFSGLQEDSAVPEAEANWNLLLDEIGFVTADEFDIELLGSIKRGYFDEVAIRVHADNLHQTYVAEEREGSIRAAWKLYHDSFDHNEAEFIASLIAAYRQNIELVTPANLHAAMTILKELRQSKQAIELLDFYVKTRIEEKELFDLSNDPFGDEVSDPDLVAAFDEIYRSFKDSRSPAEVLVQIAKSQGWGRRDIALLSKLSAEDFFDIFKSQRGADLSRAIRVSLRFADFADADADMQAIAARAIEALERIGRECRINERRVYKKYEVKPAK